MHYSSSSSDGSSRSGSPDTRATTPPASSECCNSHFPASYIRILASLPSSSTLEALFEKHASCGRLGLVIDDDAQFANDVGQKEWTKVADPVEHCVSKSYTPIGSQPILTTDPIQAGHLRLFSLASLRSVLSIALSAHSTLHVLEKPAFSYLPLTYITAHSFAPSTDGKSGNIPSIDEWKTLWANWDLITLKMIPPSMLHQKPIDLRHKCLFYIGHIPTFLDMLISKSIGGEATEPKWFWKIFERGIDPHVDDPNHCHNHSEVPEKDEDWPTLESIMSFRDGVRRRLLALYDDLASGRRVLTRNIARTLVMTHEHEGWHIETLLYMLIQRAGSGTLPPPGFTVPPWSALAEQWALTPPPSIPTVLVPAQTLVMGHDDSEADDGKDDGSVPQQQKEDVVGRTFGWDNESPRREIKVESFRAEWRPVTNGEFERFWREENENEKEEGKGKVGFPPSWVLEDGVVKVRTMYGLVPMHIAEHWPVLTAYDDLAAYARAKGGRLPTEPELRLFLDLYDAGHEGGANIGFRHWHPVPATMGLEKHGGKGTNGGVWEWTSTLFDTHDGIVPTKLFTGYSVDFFDTKHHVALGASYATIPRLAGRRTVRNFYQHNYPYPWIGARVVYDV